MESGPTQTSRYRPSTKGNPRAASAVPMTVTTARSGRSRRPIARGVNGRP